MTAYTCDQRDEAAEWFVAIRETEAPDEDTLQAWLRWLEASESNRLAFEAVTQAWNLGAALKTVAAPARPAPFWTRRFSVRLPLAAAVVVAVGALLFLTKSPPTPFTGEYATRTGEHLEIALTDGSRVSLGAKSRLVVGFAQARRDIQLTKGEAYFTVAKDRARPFVVRAGNGTITAVGTQFNVRTLHDQVTVAVTEGAVKIGEIEAPPDSEQRVQTGQQITYGEKILPAALAVTATQNARERPRWRDGWLVYRNESLQSVIDDLTRYTDRRIEVADESAAALRFSGAVNRTDIEEWLSALPESFPVTVTRKDNGLAIKTR